MVNQSIWSGTLRCGLIHLPVRAVPAVRSGKVSFQQRHTGCGGRIREGKICADDGRLLRAEDIARAYPLDDDNYIEVSGADMQALKALSSPFLVLDRFVPLEDLDPLFRSHEYLLLPKPGGEQAYVLLSAALEAERCAGIGQIVLRNREYTVAVMPYRRGLVITVLRAATEVVASPLLDDALGEVEAPNAAELALARQLVQSHRGTLDLSSIRDPYQERLHALLEQRVAVSDGQRGPATVRPVVDIRELMAVREVDAVSSARA